MLIQHLNWNQNILDKKWISLMLHFDWIGVSLFQIKFIKWLIRTNTCTTFPATHNTWSVHHICCHPKNMKFFNFYKTNEPNREIIKLLTLIIYLKNYKFWVFDGSWPFKRQLHKMVKHTQRIRRLLPTNCLSVSDHFVGLALKELKEELLRIAVTASVSLRILVEPS